MPSSIKVIQVQLTVKNLDSKVTSRIKKLLQSKHIPITYSPHLPLIDDGVCLSWESEVKEKHEKGQ